MKTITCIFLALFVTETAWSQETMNAERFKRLITSPGDNQALRPELASLPFWTNAICSVTLKYPDGKVFKEECAQTARTVAGNYVVFATESKYYNQTMYSIAGYDAKASAVRMWGLFGDVVTEGTMIFDREKKISALTANYGEGFMEISVGSASEKELSDHALVYKDGVLFMTRDVRTRPAATTTTGKADAKSKANPSEPVSGQH
jgi:hypothetical protein